MNEIKLIGFVDDTVCGSEETRNQIEELKKYQLNLIAEDGKRVEWDDIDNPEEPRTILQAIESDRAMRVDKKKFMANRPLFAVATTKDDEIVRLEFYEGHDKLEKVFDIRSKELLEKDLSDYLSEDENAYDPVEFLKSTFGIDETISKPILEKLHKDIEKD
ncbi:hypothetical protein NE686_17455 [Tissierella carlieri]|uniref:Uncharacterized protein n=1 Tax=Tissierella carlieri TaxID=689904 RepID=A0ABT1SET8_9FIRM|nr:hypothetical protein [Tissierella carlieri]MCQ4924892.1 hypothetical protein [Tissierella carlieri]